ncbi:MAG: hypothetical protein HYV27_23855 [Candidatus Hydrogenedentes bacterium]|nr:hypothetical protein [Candidatus Hydrogenedentota bacterium]
MNNLLWGADNEANTPRIAIQLEPVGAVRQLIGDVRAGIKKLKGERKPSLLEASTAVRRIYEQASKLEAGSPEQDALLRQGEETLLALSKMRGSSIEYVDNDPVEGMSGIRDPAGRRKGQFRVRGSIIAAREATAARRARRAAWRARLSSYRPSFGNLFNDGNTGAFSMSNQDTAAEGSIDASSQLQQSGSPRKGGLHLGSALVGAALVMLVVGCAALVSLAVGEGRYQYIEREVGFKVFDSRTGATYSYYSDRWKSYELPGE